VAAGNLNQFGSDYFSGDKSVNIVPLLNSVFDFIGIDADSFDQEVKKSLNLSQIRMPGENFIPL
jgi:hypothetical protein